MTFVAKFKIKEQNTIKAKFTLDFKPSKVSQLENDLEFQTKEEVNAAIQAESEIINNTINTEVSRLDNRIDEIDVDLDNTITNIVGDKLIDTNKVDRTVYISSKTFVFEQSIASTTWDIVHNLNKRPVITLVDSSGREFNAVRDYIDDNHVIIRLLSATTGKAYLN